MDEVEAEVGMATDDDDDDDEAAAAVDAVLTQGKRSEAELVVI